MQISGNVGEVVAAANGAAAQQVVARIGGLSDLIVSEVQGRFYENTYRGRKFSLGHTAVTALVAANAAATSLTATAQPVLGLYNPSTSGVNAVILQAALQDFLNNVTSVAYGTWEWYISSAQAAVSTGTKGFNRKTLAATSSQCLCFLGATALTGLVGSLTAFEPADFQNPSGLLTTTIAASTPTPSAGGVQNFDGSLIIPPGGVLALMTTLAVTTHSVSGRLLWDEVPA